MRERSFRCCALVPALAAALGAPGCRQSGPHIGERLVIARVADAISLDPARATDNESVEVGVQLFARLVRFAPGRLEPEPDLATTWTVSADGTRWVFDLRPGLTFHDGTPVDADAVVFSFERQLRPDHPNHEKDFAWLGSYQMIKEVRAVTPLRVAFQLDRPYAPFLANLAMPSAAVVSPTAVRKLGTGFAHQPVGAGAYRFVEWVEGDRITLQRFDHYWDVPARTKYLVFRSVPDGRARLVELESGASDIGEQVAPDDLPLLRLHPDLRVLTVPTASVAYLGMHTGHKPFDDVRVRRAVAHAIRRDAIVRWIYQGLAVPAVGPLPPSIWGARDDVATYEFDPVRARQLLAEAGFKPGRPLRLLAPRLPRSYLPAPERLAQVIKASLEEVGLRVEVELNDFREHLRKSKAGEHDLVLLGWVGDNGDPDNFLYTLLDRDNTYPRGSAQNAVFYDSDQYHELILGAQRTPVRVERERLYGEAQALLASDLPWVPLAHSKVIFAVRREVRNLVVQPSALGLYRLAEVDP